MTAENVKEVNELPPHMARRPLSVCVCVCVRAYFIAKVASRTQAKQTVVLLARSLSLAGYVLPTSASLLPLKLKLKTVQTFFTTPNRKQNRHNVPDCPFECCGNNTECDLSGF